jgi:hypothetical protein
LAEPFKHNDFADVGYDVSYFYFIHYIKLYQPNWYYRIDS